MGWANESEREEWGKGGRGGCRKAEGKEETEGEMGKDRGEGVKKVGWMMDDVGKGGGRGRKNEK